MRRCQGSFNDGHSAARHDVTVELGPEALAISNQDGGEIARWPYDELRLIDERPVGGALRLKRGDDGAARLNVDEPQIASLIIALAPKLTASDSVDHSTWRWLFYGTLGIAACVALLWVALPGMAGWASRRVPVAWEEALGEAVWQQMRQMLAVADKGKVRICAAPRGQAALDRLVARLVGAWPAAYRYRVAVIDFKAANAFALPGGRIVVLRGLIDSAQRPEEIAGVLAHEMAHVMRRHGTQALLRNMGLRALFGLVLGDIWAGPLGGMSETLLRLSYSREAEAEADSKGLEILAAANIRADGLADFFERLARHGGDLPEGLRFLGSHPSYDSRADLFAAARGHGGPAMDAGDWAALQAICAH